MSWLNKILESIRGNEDFSDIKSSKFREILNGDILTKKFLTKQYLLLLLIAALAFFYVGNRYYYEIQLAEEIELKKKIQDLKYESLTNSAELMQLSRESNVLKMVTEKGLQLKESEMPPIVITDSLLNK